MWNSEVAGDGKQSQSDASGKYVLPNQVYTIPKQDNKIQATQQQVNEVINVMRNNVNLVLARGEKLSDLDERAEAVQVHAQQFQTTAKKVKRKFWWQNLKMWILVGVFLIVLIAVIVLASIDWTSGASTMSSSSSRELPGH